ncbi:hypothetical protein BMS3Abin02_00448 [bacterium BMS3Abin02]|nr:hypothetical protein BMS3Abin02_00448 [bacterium BMS3Abin02]GBE20854.1 hypothetical protein BMS3Bbin01_00195 [bacterium BMS3Bbin01]
MSGVTGHGRCCEVSHSHSVFLHVLRALFPRSGNGAVALSLRGKREGSGWFPVLDQLLLGYRCEVTQVVGGRIRRHARERANVDRIDGPAAPQVGRETVAAPEGLSGAGQRRVQPVADPAHLSRSEGGRAPQQLALVQLQYVIA